MTARLTSSSRSRYHVLQETRSTSKHSERPQRIKIAFWFERERINTLNAEGELLLTLLASFAQEESRSASNNMKWSIRKGYAEGSLKQVRRCYGYLVELGEVTIVPEEAKVVKEVFERYELGELPSSIAKDLNRRKIYTLQGAKWSVNRLNVLTANIFYTGNTLLQKLFVPNHLDKKQIRIVASCHSTLSRIVMSQLSRWSF